MIRINTLLGSAAIAVTISGFGVAGALAQEPNASQPDQAQSGGQTTSPGSEAGATSSQAPAASGEPSADAGAQAGTSSEQTGEDRLVATVNDIEIRQSDVVNAIESLPPQVRQMPPQMLLPIVVEQLLTRELILESGAAENLEADPAVVAIVEPQIEALRDQAVVNVWLERALAERVTEARINQAYEEWQAANPDSTETLVVLRPQLEQALRQAAMQELTAELRDGATIVFFDATGNPLPENASNEMGTAGGGNTTTEEGSETPPSSTDSAEQGEATDAPSDPAPTQNN